MELSRTGNLLLLLLVGWCSCGTEAAADQRPGRSSIALVLGQDAHAPSPLVEPALIEALSKLEHVQLVEREAKLWYVEPSTPK